MVEPLTNQEFDKIRELLERYSGIVLAGDQEYLVETRLTELADEISAGTFSQLIERTLADEQLMLRVVDIMTIKETLWFRDESCWNTIQKMIIPELIDRSEKLGPVRIWSAACSTGQEPYSFMILLDEILERRNQKGLLERFEIVGTDISKAALSIAESGCYDAFTISRGMTSDRLNRYFEKKENTYKLEERIRQRVRFQYMNLIDAFPFRTAFDLVFCRNVAIYFSAAFKRDLFQRIAAVIRPKGVMLLGATESLFGVSNLFQAEFFENGIYYRLKKQG